MDKIQSAIKAVQGGMEVKAAAQKFGLSEAVLNDAIRRALIPNPLGFEGDTFTSQNHQQAQAKESNESSVWKTLGKIIATPFALLYYCGGQDEINSNTTSTIDLKSDISYDSTTKKTTLTVNNVKVELTEKDTETLRKQFEAEILKVQKSITELKSRVKTFKNKEAIERVNAGIKEQEDRLIRLENIASWFGGKTPKKNNNSERKRFFTHTRHVIPNGSAKQRTGTIAKSGKCSKRSR